MTDATDCQDLFLQTAVMEWIGRTIILYIMHFRLKETTLCPSSPTLASPYVFLNLDESRLQPSELSPAGSCQMPGKSSETWRIRAQVDSAKCGLILRELDIRC